MKVAMFFLDVSNCRSFSSESVQTCTRKMCGLEIRPDFYRVFFKKNMFIYLQNEVHHPFIGLEKQLLKANTQHLPFQSISHGVADAQLVANLIQTRFTGRGKLEGGESEFFRFSSNQYLTSFFSSDLTLVGLCKGTLEEQSV